MKILVCKYNKAKIFTDVVDETAIEQIKTLCNQSFVKDLKIRIMPDVHAGAGCTIGTTMTIKDKIVPNLVGVDIGCGMETYLLKEKNIDLKKLDELIYAKIPSSMNIREIPHEFIQQINLDDVRCKDFVNMPRAVHSLGTLGGGNHFIEVDKDDEENFYLVIHSGSRNLGKQVAEYYQEEAYRRLNHKSKKDEKFLIEQYKKEGKEQEISKALKELVSNDSITDIPKALAYVEEDLFEDYIHDMKIIQKYALLNRKAMAEEIINGLELNVVDHFTTIHNYIDIDHMILRKGAVSAEKGQKLLIPINMRDGSLICIGKGNEDWNCSAPHGAGRLYSRMKTKEIFNLEEFKNSMDGIYTTSLNEDTLDECPMAYKSMDDILSNITPTAEVVKTIKPVYNFKAPESPFARKKK